MEALGKENQCMICWRRKVMAVQKWTTKLGWNHLNTFSENVIVTLVIQITETFWWLLVPTFLSYILKKNNWLIKNSSWFCPRLVAHFWDPLFFTGFFLLCCRWGLGVKEWSTLVHMRSVMRCLGIYKKGVYVYCVCILVCVVSTKEKFSFKKSTPHSLLGVVGATFIYVDHNLWLFALLVFSSLLFVR